MGTSPRRLYTLSQRTSDGTTGAAAWEIIAGTKAIAVRELSIALAAATASTFGIGRPAAAGITPTSPVLFQSTAKPGTTALAKAAVAWGTGPTVPAAFLRRIGFPATIGSSIVWSFSENGILIPAGGTLVVWNLASNGVADVWALVEE